MISEFGEGVVIGCNKAAHHTEQRAGNADKEIPKRKAVIFQRAISSPKQLAAISSSCSASRLSPIQDRSSRHTRTKVPVSSSMLTTK